MHSQPRFSVWRHMNCDIWCHGICCTISHLSRWALNLLLSEGEARSARTSKQSERANGANSGKRRPKDTGCLSLITDHWRLDKVDDFINSAMTSWSKNGLFYLSSSLIQHYIMYTCNWVIQKMNKKKEHLWELPTLKKMYLNHTVLKKSPCRWTYGSIT